MTFSFSRYRAFMTCPAAAYAQYVAQVWRPRPSAAMVCGKLAEAALCGVDANLSPEDESLVSLKRGGISSDAARAIEVGKLAGETPQLAGLRTMAQQEHIEWVHEGTPWQGYIDLVDHGRGVVIDVKYTADKDREEWCDRLHCRAHYSAAAGYGFQLALYRQGMRATRAREYIAGILFLGWSEANGTPEPDYLVREWSAAQLDQYEDQIARAMTMEHVLWDGVTVAEPILETIGWETNRAVRCERRTCGWCVRSRSDALWPIRDPDRRQR